MRDEYKFILKEYIDSFLFAKSKNNANFFLLFSTIAKLMLKKQIQAKDNLFLSI